MYFIVRDFVLGLPTTRFVAAVLSVIALAVVVTSREPLLSHPQWKGVVWETAFLICACMVLYVWISRLLAIAAVYGVVVGRVWLAFVRELACRSCNLDLSTAMYPVTNRYAMMLWIEFPRACDEMLSTMPDADSLAPLAKSVRKAVLWAVLLVLIGACVTFLVTSTLVAGRVRMNQANDMMQVLVLAVVLLLAHVAMAEVRRELHATVKARIHRMGTLARA